MVAAEPGPIDDSATLKRSTAKRTGASGSTGGALGLTDPAGPAEGRALGLAIGRGVEPPLGEALAPGCSPIGRAL